MLGDAEQLSQAVQWRAPATHPVWEQQLSLSSAAGRQAGTGGQNTEADNRRCAPQAWTWSKASGWAAAPGPEHCRQGCGVVWCAGVYVGLASGVGHTSAATSSLPPCKARGMRHRGAPVCSRIPLTQHTVDPPMNQPIDPPVQHMQLAQRPLAEGPHLSHLNPRRQGQLQARAGEGQAGRLGRGKGRGWGLAGAHLPHLNAAAISPACNHNDKTINQLKQQNNHK